MLPSAQPVKYVVFNVRKMSYTNMLNKRGPSIEPWGTPEIVTTQELQLFAYDYWNNFVVYLVNLMCVI